VCRDYFCRTSPTPVDGRLLKSSASVLKLVDSGNEKQLASKIKAHTFSQTWRTLFVHFDHQKINGEGTNKKIKKMKKMKKRKRNEVEDPEKNLFVLLKNISPSESEEIAEALKDMGYNVEKVERFKGLPMAEVLFKTSNDVKQAFTKADQDRISFNAGSVWIEPFRKGLQQKTGVQVLWNEESQI
ncbi:hypothetical protein RFI_33774, partial [Reticulomyxa filosa]